MSAGTSSLLRSFTMSPTFKSSQWRVRQRTGPWWCDSSLSTLLRRFGMSIDVGRSWCRLGRGRTWCGSASSPTSGIGVAKCTLWLSSCTGDIGVGDIGVGDIATGDAICGASGAPWWGVCGSSAADTASGFLSKPQRRSEKKLVNVDSSTLRPTDLGCV